MTDEEFKQVCLEAVEDIRGYAPYDTGNLRYNAIRVEFPSPQECRIYVDESIAPYMPFTNEPWVSPKWNGKKNPNEGWWQDAVDYIAETIAEKLKGTVYEQ